jgi:hypothetical protein
VSASYDQEEVLGTYAKIVYDNQIKTRGDDRPMTSFAKMDEIDVLRVKLEMLKHQHRDLDSAIAALHDRGAPDMLTIKRLKKQKLALKDQIVVLQDRIFPDIIA